MHYIEVNGQPVHEPDFLVWARWLESADRRILNTVIGKVRVSTVFMGMDSLGAGPPLVYETMVFGGELDDCQWRYATRSEAALGHEAAVVRCLKGEV